ncbi:MAG: hypothetical protein QMD71_03515 [bacterium]|nr:hypothetical protein [bacterium]
MLGAILGGFTILGVFLTLTAWINGRSIKKYIGEKLDEGFKKIDEGFKRIDDRTAKIAELIVVEGERTKELIKALKS